MEGNEGRTSRLRSHTSADQKKFYGSTKREGLGGETSQDFPWLSSCLNQKVRGGRDALMKLGTSRSINSTSQRRNKEMEIERTIVVETKISFGAEYHNQAPGSREGKKKINRITERRDKEKASTEYQEKDMLNK